MTNKLCEDPRSPSTRQKKTIDFSWLTDTIPFLSFTFKILKRVVYDCHLRCHQASLLTKLKWQQMIFCVLIPDFSETSSLLPETLFSLHFRVASTISLATFPQRSFVDLYLFTLCPFQASFFSWPVLSPSMNSILTCIFKVLRKEWIKDWFNPQKSLKETEERRT